VKLIDPVTEKQCKAYYGRPVYVMLHDGTQIIGILSKLDGGKLYLNADGDKRPNTKRKSKISFKKKSVSKRPIRSVKSPYPAAIGPALTIDLGHIGLLLAVE